MVKAIGALCILFGGLLARQYQLAALRRELAVVSDLLAVLCRMSEEIRLKRTPLPRLLDRLSQGRDAAVSDFLGAVSAAARQGEDTEAAWQAEAKRLPVSSEVKIALEELAKSLSDDEESICKAVSLACMELSRNLEELRRKRPETEKRTTALCLSATALLVILLI